MYKIYINETPLYLKSTEESQQNFGSEQDLSAQYLGKTKTLFHYIDLLEKGSQYYSVTLYADDLEQLVNDFVSQYKIVEAAGGVVLNTENNVLLIFRRGFWDLPKGKIDLGESKEDAAIREVQEETGLQQITLGASLGETYHTYKEGKSRILKRTYWYEMHTSETNLTPQTEEDIEQAVWMELSGFLQQEDRVYKSVREVLMKLRN